jgi:hypothetical protein
MSDVLRMSVCNNKIQDNNTTDIPECLHLCPLLKAITSTVHTFFPSAAVALNSSLLRRCKEAVTAVLISSSDSIRLLQYVIPHVQTTSNRMRRDLESMVDVPKFWLFTAISQSQLILHECAVIMAIDWHAIG